MTSEQVLDMITTQSFAEFLAYELENYVTGDALALPRHQMIQVIERLMPVCPIEPEVRQEIRNEVIQDLRTELSSIMNELFDTI
jgi:hypothetical protein